MKIISWPRVIITTLGCIGAAICVGKSVIHHYDKYNNEVLDQARHIEHLNVETVCAHAKKRIDGLIELESITKKYTPIFPNVTSPIHRDQLWSETDEAYSERKNKERESRISEMQEAFERALENDHGRYGYKYER